VAPPVRTGSSKTLDNRRLEKKHCLIGWDSIRAVTTGVRVWIWCKHEKMDPSCVVSTVHAAGGVMAWGVFSCTLWALEPIEHSINSTAHLSIAADHVHPFVVFWWLLPAGQSTVSLIISSSAPLDSDGLQSPDLKAESPSVVLWTCSRHISAAAAWCHHVYRPTSLRNVSNTLLDLRYEELRRPGASKVYLIKWPVSVYHMKVVSVCCVLGKWSVSDSSVLLVVSSDSTVWGKRSRCMLTVYWAECGSKHIVDME